MKINFWENNLQKNRIEWTDISKGYLTIFVIMFHFKYTPDILTKITYPFTLPLFFFISGYFFKTKGKSFIDFLQSRICSLVIPIIFFKLITLILNGRTIEDLKNAFISIFIQIYGYETLWFVACLFTCQIIMFLVLKFSNKLLKKFIITVLVLSTIGFLYSTLVGIALPWHFDIALTQINFFGGGFLFRKYERSFKKYNKMSILIIVLLLYLILIFIGVNYDIHLRQYGNPIIYIITAYIGIWIFYSLSQVKNSLKLIDFIGQNSIVYYGFHGMLLSLFTKIIDKISILFSISMNIYFSYFITPITIILVCFILTIPSIILNNYFPFFIGKKNNHKNNRIIKL